MIKYVFNPFTGNFDAIYIGGGSTPSLQAVTAVGNTTTIDIYPQGAAYFGAGGSGSYYQSSGSTVSINGQGKQGWIAFDDSAGHAAGLGFDGGEFKFDNGDWGHIWMSLSGGTRYINLGANNGNTYNLYISEDTAVFNFATTDIRGGIYDTTNGTGFGTSGYVLTTNGSGWSWQSAGGGGGVSNPLTSNLDVYGYSLVDTHVGGSNSFQLDSGTYDTNLTSYGQLILTGSTNVQMISGGTALSADPYYGANLSCGGVATFVLGHQYGLDGFILNTQGGYGAYMNPYQGGGFQFFSFDTPAVNIVSIQGYGMTTGNTGNLGPNANANSWIDQSGNILFGGQMTVSSAINQGAGPPGTILTNYQLYVDTVTGLAYVN